MKVYTILYTKKVHLMALQCNTLHRFLILTMIYCSSSFGMNLHCLYMRDDNGPLPYVARLPFSQINFLKNLIEKKLKDNLAYFLKDLTKNGR